MVARLTWASILSIVMIPLLTLGLMLELEGILVLLSGLLVGLAVRLISKMKFPKFTWITVVVAIGLLALAIGVALINFPTTTVNDPNATVVNGELMLWQGMPLGILVLWLSRVAILPMAAGLVYYAVRLIVALVEARRARP